MTTATEALTAAVRGLSEREAAKIAQFLGGMALAAHDEGLARVEAVWRAMGLVVFEELERQEQVLAAAAEDLDGGDDAPG